MSNYSECGDTKDSLYKGVDMTVETCPQVVTIYPVEIIKQLPDDFWIKAPTYNNIVGDAYLYPKRKEDPPSYADFPLWKQLGTAFWSSQTSLYVLCIDDYSFRKTLGHYYYKSIEDRYTPDRGKYLRLTDYEQTCADERKSAKAFLKIAATWNKCRRDALRRQSLLDTPDQERLKNDEQRMAVLADQREQTLDYLDELIQTLQDYKKLVDEGTLTQENMRVIFDATNQMTAINGSLKKAFQSFKNRPFMECPACKKRTALQAPIPNPSHLLCFRCRIKCVKEVHVPNTF